MVNYGFDTLVRYLSKACEGISLRGVNLNAKEC